jgi:hypothetical protein
MKKIIIIAFAILTTGLVSSCTKDNVKPKTTIVSDKSDMGSGDLAGDATGTGDGTSGQ